MWERKVSLSLPLLKHIIRGAVWWGAAPPWQCHCHHCPDSEKHWTAAECFANHSENGSGNPAKEAKHVSKELADLVLDLL